MVTFDDIMNYFHSSNFILSLSSLSTGLRALSDFDRLLERAVSATLDFVGTFDVKGPIWDAIGAVLSKMLGGNNCTILHVAYREADTFML